MRRPASPCDMPSCRASPGDTRVALAIGTEQLTASPVPEVTRGLAEAMDPFPATAAASTRAYSRAGVTADDLHVVELHDCFSIAEIIDCEDLGLLPRGEAAAAIADGATTYGVGTLVVNPSGGLLARGHPVGATGLAQIHEIASQLRGTAARQVAGAELGMAHNLGDCGAGATVTVLGRA